MTGFVIVLTFVTAFNGSTVEQAVVKCPDVTCVTEQREEAWASLSCQRFRLWNESEFSPATGLRTFINPPREDWSKG